jgi:hypothetical protein
MLISPIRTGKLKVFVPINIFYIHKLKYFTFLLSVFTNENIVSYINLQQIIKHPLNISSLVQKVTGNPDGNSLSPDVFLFFITDFHGKKDLKN